MPNLLRAWLLAALASATTSPADDAARQRKCDQIVGEYDAAREKAIQARKAAKTEAEESAVVFPGPSDFAPRLMILADAQPDDAAARKAMLWIVEHRLEWGGAERLAMVSRAVDLLLKFHKDDESVGLVLLKIVSFPSSPRDRFLRPIYEQTSNRANRGRACLALAQYLKMKGEYIQQLRMPAYKAEDPTIEIKMLGAAYFAALRETDPQPMLAESERLFERVLADYARIDHLPHHRYPGRVRSLGEVAERDLRELREHAVGKPAPEIEGKDVDGRAMKLSDSRGKVVVLVFWGSWCGPCMAQVPHERLLAERMRGRPFVLVGVNSDEDREALKVTIEREKITWRSWFDDGRVGGPIAHRWNVSSWPTVYVVDPRGVIRARPGGYDALLDKMVDDLVGEAEKEAASR